MRGRRLGLLSHMHRMEKRINLAVTNRVPNLLDAVHPLLLLFSGRGRDAVEGVVALHYPSISFRLACFYHLVLVVGDEKLKAVLQVWIRQGLKKCHKARSSTPSPAGGAVLTGFLSSTSLMLRFSSGMIPLGSLSWINARTTTECWRSRWVAVTTRAVLTVVYSK